MTPLGHLKYENPEIQNQKRLKYLEFKTAKLSTYVWILSIDGLKTS
jgi:hypothetical protein